MTHNVIQPDVQTTASHVAPLLPPTPAAPEPARRINFVKALLLFWLLPRRCGPHLAVGSTWRAFAAHAIAILSGCLAIGIVAVGENYDRWPSPHELRVGAAWGVLNMAVASATSGWNWLAAIVIVGAVPLAELGIVALATAFMPWCAGGDSAWSVWKRSVKNMYWSTTIAIPLSILLLVGWGLSPQASRLDEWLDPDVFLVGKAHTGTDVLIIAIGLIALGAPVILLLRMWFVGANRYVGEPAGPAFAPREPRCDRCGYLIIGLPVTTNCPECGLPVRDSLPDGQRRPNPWQEHEWRPRGLLEALRMQWRVLRGIDVFRRIPVHQGLTAARHFWWVTFLFLLVSALAMVRLHYGLAGEKIAPDELVVAAMAAIGGPIALQTTMMFLGCLWSQWRYGIRDYRISAIVCYYASPLLWPLMGLLILATVTITDPVQDVLFRAIDIPIGRFELRGDELAGIVCTLGALAVVLFWWLRLCAALRSARYANV
jgi:hypothetical protein